jgi:hypothetical protein
MPSPGSRGSDGTAATARDHPRLDIISDTEADIVNGDRRFRLSGPEAASIIAIYRHCRDDLSADSASEGMRERPQHSPTDADLFLWGVTEGMRYSHWVVLEKTLADIKARRGPE